MKNYVLDNAINIINKKYNYDDIKIEKLRYGLEGIYLTITKAIVIFSIALILGIFKELLVFLLFFNILRFSAFGIHAKNSIVCLIYSSLIFLMLPIISKYLIINNLIKTILFIILILLISIYAPADTEKRPIVSNKRRMTYKIISTTNAIIFMIFSLKTNNKFISNALLLSLFLEVIMILPVTYRLYKQPYNNYLAYKKMMVN